MAKPSRKKSGYSGVLAKPMELHVVPTETLATGSIPEETWRDMQREANGKNLEQFVERIVALFRHYDIAPGEFTNLALELASAHVPGFRFRSPGEKRRGRPSGVGTGKELFERVEQFREILPLADKKGLKRACEIVSARRGLRCYGVKPTTLRKMVTDAKRAPASDLGGLALGLARFTVDRGIVGPLLEHDANAGALSRTGTEIPQRVRRK